LISDVCVYTGLPIRPVFSKHLPARDALRKRLGLQRKLPAVLLVGGGEGMGALEATVSELDRQLGSAAQVSDDGCESGGCTHVR
jgi:1,2-diacylglycerol 3-beta-galactosyltransferase